jgi:uncharacterized protein YjbI with pentapeptide repeats
MTTSTPPEWPCCGQAPDPDTDFDGCRGRRVDPFTKCLAHLNDVDRARYLTALQPGDDLDHRGTPFTEGLLAEMLAALRDPATQWSSMGLVRFDNATFSGDARFGQVVIMGDAFFDRVEIENSLSFNRAVIRGDGRFEQVKIGGDALFDRATVRGHVWFGRAEIGESVEFGRAEISGGASLDGAKVARNAMFERVAIGGTVNFDHAAIGGEARFNRSKIDGDVLFDRVKVGGSASFGGARITGVTRFNSAEIGGVAGFDRAKINTDAEFHGIRVRGHTRFRHAKVRGRVGFSRARIDGDADFEGARIGSHAQFSKVQISGRAMFQRAEFGRTAHFGQAEFGGNVKFDGTKIGGDANFQAVVFRRATALGPLTCIGTLDLSKAIFETAVTIEAAAGAVHCWGTRWASAAALRLRYASVDLTHAVMEYPVSIATDSRPFTPDGTEMTERDLGGNTHAKVVSLRGVDAAHLTLTNVDLTNCLFAGTIHLDQLRLEGRYPLPLTPSGVRWRGLMPVRWTPRRTLAEEQRWRASRGTDAEGWMSASEGEEVLEPIALAPMYRQLRKAFEDGKHEPGAADFYYGEMEMRRHADDIPWSERSLLTAYWALSGYGLRAARALGWLTVAMLITILFMMGFGVPNESPKQEIVREKFGGQWKTVIDTPAPRNPTGDRFTSERFEKALNVTLNSVVFRSSGQDLTTAGTYIEMTSRLFEPVLLGFAVLAVRGRVKRGS